MLIFSMGVSIDGYINDRQGGFAWTVPSDELFAFHLDRVRELGAHLCSRRLYETMRPWETDPALRTTVLQAEFGAVWSALPKIVFSRTLSTVQGNARLARAPLAEEIATALAAAARGQDAEIGGATLAATAIEAGLVDELRMFLHPVVVGGGTPYLPPVATDIDYELVETRTFDDRVIYERYRRRP